MKKGLLFIGTFALAFGAVAFFTSFEDANQAKIDAKYDEMKSKWMDEKWGECTATVMADAQAEYADLASSEAPDTDNTTTGRTTKPNTGNNTGTNTNTTPTVGGTETNNTGTTTTTTTTPTKDPKNSKMGGNVNTDDKNSKIGGDTKATTVDKKKGKMGGK